MNQMLKFSVPGLNLLFSQLSSSDSKLFWVTTVNHDRQIYIGPAYEKIWGRPCQEIYNDMTSLYETIVDSKEKVVQGFKSREANGSANQNIVFCCISDTKGNLHFIKDTGFYLFDQTGKPIAIAGVAEDISLKQWEIESEQNGSNHASPLLLDLGAILNKEFDLSSEKEEKNQNELSVKLIDETAKLTAREKECLFQLSSGKSAKRIARVLEISPRTVEIHIDNIKRKLECRTRLEVISKLSHIIQVV